MKKLFKNANIFNVFTENFAKGDLLVENDKIIGVGDYSDAEADEIVDLMGKNVTPGFIDGHIHIESTMLSPWELAKALLPHGTVGIVADPHEIANVSGVDGIRYMLEASNFDAFHTYIMLPSCVPSTNFDEAGAVLTAEDLAPLYIDEKFGDRVLGLAEMMNYPGVLGKDPDIVNKIHDALKNRRVVDGHAPLVTGKGLDAYVSAFIDSDHETSSFEEAKERIEKGQWVMIRQGTAAKNLNALLPLFDEPYCQRSLLVTDDIHPSDLLVRGHIDNIIRLAVQNGKSVNKALKMASFRVCERFGIKFAGAIAPGYRADFLVIDDLEKLSVEEVYVNGKKVVEQGKLIADIRKPDIPENIEYKVRHSFNLPKITAKALANEKEGKAICRVIKVIPGQLLTDELHEEIDFSNNSGIDIERDILKIAVIERHHNTGHIGIGFIKGIGLKKGAIASSVSHDSHNIVVIGTNDEDIALAANHIIEIGGGIDAVAKGEVLKDMPLPVGGLMTDENAENAAKLNGDIRDFVYELGVSPEISPYMNMAFVSLTVIPSLKLSTMGLVDVNQWKVVDLVVDN